MKIFIESIQFFGLFWLFFIVPYYTFYCIVRLLFRKRLNWCMYDLATLYLPIIIWTLMFIIINNKTLSNGAIEPFILGIAAIILIIVRLIIGKKNKESLISLILLIILCIISIIISLIISPLPL